MFYMAQFICSFFCCPKILYGLEIPSGYTSMPYGVNVEKRTEDRRKSMDKKDLTGGGKPL